MKCALKDALQRQCTTEWDAYVAEATKSGLSVDLRSGIAIPPAISELALKQYTAPVISDRYSTALSLRGKHLKASMELSRHLSRHRC
jgi:hypothetical protein